MLVEYLIGGYCMELVCNREYDSRAEKITVRFLKNFFYEKMKIFNYKLIDDEERQKTGIDVILTLNNGMVLNVDNKSANIQWMNSNLTNFAIELSFLAKEKDENGNDILLDDGTECRKQVYGWFINPESKTDVYLFYWVHLKEKNGFPYSPKAKKSNYYKYFEYEDIDWIEVSLIEKRVLKSWCKMFDLTDKKLICLNEELRSQSTREDGRPTWNRYIRDNHGNKIDGLVGITKNNSYKERPILLILNHDLAERLSFMHYVVYPTKIKYLFCSRREKSKKEFLKLKDILKYRNVYS